MINHNLNGLLRFTDATIYLDLGAPITIVAHTLDGNVYYLAPSEFAKLDLRDKKSFNFRLKALGNFLERPELARQLLKRS